MSPLRPALGRAGGPRLFPFLLATPSLVSSIAFVLAPVERPEAVYAWPSASGDAGAVAVPLMLHRPAQLTATVDCATARDAASGDVLLSTTPLELPAGTETMPGLRIQVVDDELRIRSGDTDLEPQAVPADGDCTWRLTGTVAATTLERDGREVLRQAGDVRPAVAGVFSGRDSPDGLAVEVTADTVFQTRPSALKIGLAVLSVLTLAAALVLVARAHRSEAVDGAGRQADRAGAGPGRRPRTVRLLTDAAVVLGAAVWAVIGPLTVDDGYIAGIVGSRESNGYVGNVYRWFNAPEAPFGWFYELLDLWSRVSTSVTWLRTPSALLGILTWFLVARGLLPRLGAYAARPWTYPLAAAVFGIWWLPTGLGLRPEAWVAAGLAAVVVLVERGLARRTLLPVLLGFVVAAATLAVTPTGAVAFLPLIVALLPILRLARGTSLGLPVLATVAAAATGSGLLLMFTDQSLGAALLANRIRTELPGTVPWSSEIQRWRDLLVPGSHDGSLVRRVPVLLTLIAVTGILWQRTSGRLPSGGASAVLDRLTAGFALSLVVLLFTPTKWTMHFGAFAATGTALIIAAIHLFGRSPATRAGAEDPTEAAARRRESSLPVTAVALVAVLLVAAVSWAGWNQWPFISNQSVPWRDLAPQLLGTSVSSVFLALAALVSAVATVVYLRERLRSDDVATVAPPRWLPSPGAATVVVVLMTLALLPLSFLKASWDRRDTYSLASDAVASVSGNGCGMAEDLRVERDPVAGLLPLATAAADDDPRLDGSRLDGFVAVVDGRTPAGPELRAAGEGLPGWAATGHAAESGDGPAELVTPWFRLPEDRTGADLPLVVTTAGSRAEGTTLDAQFGTSSGTEVSAVGRVGVPAVGGAPESGDAWLDLTAVPADADVVRLVATDGGAQTQVPLAVSVPRVPVTEPFLDVVDPAEAALVDWPVALVFPCQELASQTAGITEVPRWRIALAGRPEDGDIAITPEVGGPFAAARLLVDQEQVPVYLRNRPLERTVWLYSWEPRTELAEPQRRITPTTVAGWAG